VGRRTIAQQPIKTQTKMIKRDELLYKCEDYESI
jgi:hypothetical protein